MSYEIKREKISEEIRKTITPKRQKHIFNVVKEAEKLCQIYGGDREICVTAALLHDIVKDHPVEELDRLIEKYGAMPVLFAGGVMSNKLMRGAISKRFEAYFAEPEFSADNAAGIALLCRKRHLKNCK